MASKYIDEVFGPTGLLSKRFPGYAPRSGQLAMVETVDQAISTNRHALIEAGTGTGKSLAYAVPTIWHITHSFPQPPSIPCPPLPEGFLAEYGEVERDQEPDTGRRAVIVTANIALQEQLVKKDLPLLKEVLPWPFSFSLLKGMSNYLCLERLEDGQDKFSSEDVQMAVDICAWGAKTETGDKSELSFDPPTRLWSRFSVSSDECSGKDCEFYKQCFSKLAAARAKEADIVVTNYAMFFLDLLIKQKSLGNAYIIPPYSIAVLDEGHKAVDIARNYFGWKVTPGAIDVAGAMLPAEQKIALHKAQSIFFFELKKHRQSKEYKARIKKPNIVPADGLLGELARAAETYSQILSDCTDEDEQRLTKEQRKNRKKLKSKRLRCEQLAKHIQQAITFYAPIPMPWTLQKDGPNPYARWYVSNPSDGGDGSTKTEANLRLLLLKDENIYFIDEEREKVSLCAMPVSVADALKAMLFRETGSVTVTSATLAGASGSFDFIRDDLGVEKPTTLLAESPFDWYTQALLVLPQDIPDPNAANFSVVISERLVQTVDFAKGRTLGLFTSYKNMNAAHERLKRGPWRILKQGDMPRTQLIKEFRADVSSVLLGVESFWAGVDVQGESLSCVFIDRLPFATPDDPLLDALAERDRHGWFMKYAVPQAIIAFKQGFGRLIRTTTDKGVVVVCDRRITTKSYGQMFLQSLPPVRRSFALVDVKNFLEDSPLSASARNFGAKSLFDNENFC